VCFKIRNFPRPPLSRDDTGGNREKLFPRAPRNKNGMAKNGTADGKREMQFTSLLNQQTGKSSILFLFPPGKTLSLFRESAVATLLFSAARKTNTHSKDLYSPILFAYVPVSECRLKRLQPTREWHYCRSDCAISFQLFYIRVQWRNVISQEAHKNAQRAEK
jgi:hypothetical protein